MPGFDPTMLGPAVVARLREALSTASYTVAGVSQRLGEAAHGALLRNATPAALRATTGGDPLDTMTRLFALQVPVPRRAVDRALPGLLGPLVTGGVLETAGEEVRASIDVRPYGDETHDWWVVSDLTPGLDGSKARIAADHVLGVSPASTSLAQLTVRDPVGSALDLGTGCGVQALHLRQHAARVVATDVNARALAMAALTASLNGVAYDLRAGSLYEPVNGEAYDLITSNPPFVVGPPVPEPLIYRDSGLPGDEVVRRIVTGAPAQLRSGGWCQVLANWAHHADEPWQERVAGWVEPTGCDAWVLQRETADLPTYVEMWLADAGLLGAPGYHSRYDVWMSWFEQQGIEAVGFGWLCLHNAGREAAVVRIEDWPYDIEPPLWPHIADWARRADLLTRLSDQELLETCLRRRPHVVQETRGEPGAADPELIVLRQQAGVRRARRVDTVEAALVGACDGDLGVGQVLDALATLLERDTAELRTRYVPVVRDLVAEGWLDE